MKLLLGILLALVLIEGVAIVGLYLRQDQQPHALITRAGPIGELERLYGIPLDLKTWTRASIDHCVASDE